LTNKGVGVTLIPFEWNFSPDSKKLYTSQYLYPLNDRANLKPASDINSDPIKPYQSAMQAYWASKAFARLATRKFVEQNHPRWDYVNLLPSVVIGPDERISATSGKAAELAVETRAAVLAPVLDASMNSPFPYVGVPVHVADVAKAHVDALDANHIPGDSEFILCSDTPDGVNWDNDVRNVARKYFADAVEKGILPLTGSLQTIKWRLDGLTTEKTFGWEFTNFEQTAKDLIGQYLQLKKNG
jgi:nucleoside-diphosphate-sugar epimerase